jgi:hypothetical protein
MRKITTLTGKNLPRLAVAKPGWPSLHMPDDMVVVRNRDGDEAGDYRLVRHGDVAGDPNWTITDIDPKDLD